MENKDKEKQEYNKWKSRRWIVTCWAMVMITAIFIVSSITNSDHWSPLAMTLAATPAGFTALETINKRKPGVDVR